MTGWKAEARALAALALPLVAGNLAWSAIAATDLLLLGRVNVRAVAAGALALALYTPCIVFGLGLTAAAAPLVASERGRRLHAVRDIRRTVRQTLWSGGMVTIPLWLLLWHGEALLLLLGQEPALAADAGRLLRGLMWALPLYLTFLTLDNFVAALERPLWGLVVTAAAIPVNVVAGWAMIFGHAGLPALGLLGAGLAGVFSSGFMAFGMVAVVTLDRRFRRYHLFGRFWVPDWARLRTVWSVGLPIAVTLLLEVSVFNAAVFLMGLIGGAALAAHAVAIQIASLVFMVPMGIGRAATVRVGFAQGRQDLAGVKRAGAVALVAGLGFATVTALVLALAPRPLIAGFLDLADPANAAAAALAIAFLRVAALFQLVDAAQAILAGMLRGLQDTRVPMLIAAVGYWGVGLGLGALLAFPVGLAGVGVWLGLASGLAVVAVLLWGRWRRRTAAA
ncbi:MATE family efflux transporter [Sphingomonas jatrophae]|uniref:Multidrug resistance protein, MATE family n=1 Tax=Sphingomonas jatrophae TaxID=1166337 RepID=A0A1I6JNS3_9SPHN|nr:MATE family efflux transporter [Sphingomonas jatrophae]SFR80604.1 multidrug resistance protein, MATE family [Sphingomonas jatrophae]